MIARLDPTSSFGVLNEILGILMGTILCLLYLSPAKEYFKSTHTLND